MRKIYFYKNVGEYFIDNIVKGLSVWTVRMRSGGHKQNTTHKSESFHLQKCLLVGLSFNFITQVGENLS